MLNDDFDWWPSKGEIALLILGVVMFGCGIACFISILSEIHAK